MTIGLVIFDCDGVLVDSEPLANAVMTEALSEIGIDLSYEEVCRRFIGLSMERVVELVEESLGQPAPGFADSIQRRTFEVFRRGLRPIPGVEHALEQYCCPDRELLAVLQLFRAGREVLFNWKIEKGPKVAEVPVTLPSGEERIQTIYNDTVLGYNKLGKEVVRVTVEEPTFERPEAHINSL